MNEAALPTPPLDLLRLLKDGATFKIAEQRLVSLLVLAFDLADALQQAGNLVESFLPGVLGHGRIHVGPFLAFAVGRRFQIGFCVAESAQRLQLQLCMYRLLLGRFQEDGRDLFVALLLGDRSKVGVLVSRLRLARKRRPQVLLRLRAFQFGHATFSITVWDMGFSIIRSPCRRPLNELRNKYGPQCRRPLNDWHRRSPNDWHRRPEIV